MMIETTEKEYNTIECQDDSNETPFIRPGKSVVLKKINPRNPDNFLYFLFEASHEFSKNGSIEKYTIRYRNILKPHHDSNRYFGYSIIIENESSLEICNELNNQGLDFLIEPKGLGIGSIILNHLFHWARENHPALRVPGIGLSPNDALNIENKERRDTLYRNIGLRESRAKTIADLTPRISKKGFEVIELNSLLKTLLEKDSESEYRIEHLETILKKYDVNSFAFYKEFVFYRQLFYGSWVVAIILGIKFFDEIKSLLF